MDGRFGGLLIGLGGWRMIFTVNIPLSLACLILGAARLPRLPTPESEKGSRRAGATFDVVGMILFAAMLTSLMLFLMSPQLAHWYLLMLTVATGAGLAVRELGVADPFIDLRVLGGNAPLLATYAARGKIPCSADEEVTLTMLPTSQSRWRDRARCHRRHLSRSRPCQSGQPF